MTDIDRVIAPQPARGIPNILPECVEPFAEFERALPFVCVLLQVTPVIVHRAETALGFRAPGVRREPFAHELLGAHVEVRANFVVDVARDDVVAAHAEAKELPDARTNHADFGAAVRIVVTVSE